MRNSAKPAGGHPFPVTGESCLDFRFLQGIRRGMPPYCP